MRLRFAVCEDARAKRIIKVDSSNKQFTRIFNKAKALAHFNIRRSKPTMEKEMIELDKKLVFSLSKSRIPNLRQLKYFRRYLNKSELWLVNICFVLILASLAFLGVRFYKNNLETLPAYGGEYIEGLVGSPKYINPLYASLNDADNDISSLVFSTLFQRDKNGELKQDLAESYQVSGDGKTYTIKIRPGVKWHNGSALTPDDVIFTFNAIKDSQYKSSLRASFSGVEIDKVDDNTIKFVLAEPYAAFLDLLTFGILPQELWQQIPANAASLAELNIKPVGSGPFKFKSFVKDKAGNIRSYVLAVNSDYYGQKPLIEKITFKFFGNTSEAVTALNSNLINGISYLPRQQKNELVAQDSLNFHKLNLPQLTAIFFNPKGNQALADKNVRQALAFSLDKRTIVGNTLGDDALIIDGPILPNSFAYNSINKYKYDKEKAAKLLDDAGWKIVEVNDEDIKKAQEDAKSKDAKIKKNAEEILKAGKGKWRVKKNIFLAIELTTSDNPEYSKIVEEIAKYWKELNFRVTVKIVPAGQIQSDTIKMRNFSALFYGEFIGADPDPYPLWHSSQSGENGLNIADYSNKDLDKALEEARLTVDKNVRKDKYKKFQEIMAEDEPAIFFYSPSYIYVQTKKVKGFDVGYIFTPKDRFSNISDWYINTKKQLHW